MKEPDAVSHVYNPSYSDSGGRLGGSRFEVNLGKKLARSHPNKNAWRSDKHL
jgi:hypothetical protein